MVHLLSAGVMQCLTNSRDGKILRREEREKHLLTQGREAQAEAESQSRFNWEVVREPNLKPIWGVEEKPAIPTDCISQHKHTLHVKTLCACSSPAGTATAQLPHLQDSGYPSFLVKRL